MTGPVLIEGRNLALRKGTGIASYARNLVATLRGLGYELDVLFDADFPLTPGRPKWNEIKLHDRAGRGAPPMPWSGSIVQAARYVTAAPFGVTAQEIAQSLDGIDPGLFPGLAGFARRQAVERLFGRADQHLLRYGRRLPVRPLRRPSLFHATHPAALEVKGCANIYTIHDLVPLRLPHATLDNKRTHLKILQELARSADRIVTVSEYSRQDIIRHLGVDESRVVNTYQAVTLPATLLDRPADETAREIAAFGLMPQGYFLFVGAIEPKKNLERLIDAFLSAGSKHPLVIVGKLGWGFEKVLLKIQTDAEAVESRGATAPRILHLSYLPFHQVVSLMGRARALLFPSLYEGFGLPALEAMLLGTPVLASNTASLPEVVGEAGVLVDPHDAVTMARAIRMLDLDGDLRAELARRGPLQAERFSPERYARRLSELYAELT